ncbi:TIGR03086 family metal-binding protein [Cryptosporangium phraense]|uniref:TIGR03086 family protein n=1 Tax=Cryptosporangium phraense TaxID=2593070 RepID=A0A545ALA5_9ACTN|nr:TIGR03086 family metal-binding protein [Cryptosporangium phraense]TQS42104.1 TIGR03086 family protein [Cryptosporangium phraense]
MSGYVEGIVERYVLAGAGFERRLRRVRPGQWAGPTPCREWDVRALVNHMTRGNLNYVALLRGATAADFLRLRDADALGEDPVETFVSSVRACADAFAEPGALDRPLDYPLGPADGAQVLAVRTTDTLIHTWDLARAIGDDEILDPGLVEWAVTSLGAIYEGLAETPADAGTTHRYFDPAPEVSEGAERQTELLAQMGRNPRTAMH